MAISVFKRKELKFLLKKSQYENFLNEIKPYIIADEYCKNGETYTINNIYFDTEDNYLIRTSISKPYFKEKLRLRSYYSQVKPSDKMFLEIKRKINSIVTKRRVIMSVDKAKEFLKTGEISCESYLQKQVLSEIKEFIQRYQLKPSQYISYKREAYFARDDRDLRITFDNDILARRSNFMLLNLDFDDSRDENVIDSDMRILEIKATRSLPLWLVHSLSKHEIYKTSFSKYGAAYKNFITNKKTNQRSTIYA